MTLSEKQKKHLEKLHKKYKGEYHSSWRGGTRKHGKDGYIREKCENHPNCDDRGYVMQHRLVMERHLGRTLTRKEVVHHINGITNDNRIENLMVFNAGEHTTLHRLGKHHSKETKEKIRQLKIGKKHSKETKKKMSKTRIGHNTSEETRKKIGIKTRQRWQSKEYRERVMKKMKTINKKKKLNGDNK